MADIFELFKKIASGRNEAHGKPTAIVAGLGNPGEKYARTRHNAGFLAMDYIAEKYDLGKFRVRFKATVAEGTVGTRRVLFMKPQTFMNHSGEAVREAADFYKIAPENIIVISDDINLAPGVIRIRESGSDGGQRGLRSIIEHMGTETIGRIRIGVGAKPRPDYDLADWVLGEIPKADQEAMFDAFARAADALPLVLEGKYDEAAARYNGKPRAATPPAESDRGGTADTAVKPSPENEGGTGRVRGKSKQDTEGEKSADGAGSEQDNGGNK